MDPEVQAAANAQRRARARTCFFYTTTHFNHDFHRATTTTETMDPEVQAAANAQRRARARQEDAGSEDASTEDDAEAEQVDPEFLLDRFEEAFADD